MTITKRVSKNGDISYRIKVSMGYTYDGKQKIKSITYKPDPNLTVKQAEKEAYKQGIIFEEKCKSGKVAERRIKFQALAEEYLEFIEKTNKLKCSSLVRLKNFRERTYEALGNIYIDKLTRNHIQNFIFSLSEPGVNKRTGKGLSQKTQKHYISFISNVMNYAILQDYIKDSPCHHISVVKTNKDEELVYTLEETQKLLNEINNKANIDYKVFFSILPHCGMRRGEVLGLEYDDINFITGEVTISRTSNYRNSETGVYTDTPKTKNSFRKIFLPDDVLNLILELKKSQTIKAKKCGDSWHKTNRLFVTWNGEPIHPNTPYTWLKRFCKKESIPFKGLKAFRHFFATQAIQSGVDIKTVSSMMGHAQTSTTLNTYTHAIKQSNINGFNTVANLISNKDHGKDLAH